MLCARVGLCLIGCISAAHSETQGARQTTADVENARLALAAYPEDVDLKLKLATRLAWNGEYEEAKALTDEVIKEVPEYWDAHVLALRVDAWSGRYGEARTRALRLLNVQPPTLEMLQAASDAGIWSEDFELADKAADALLRLDTNADSIFRKAQAQLGLHRSLRARRLADQVLDIQPDHKQARAMRDSIQFARLTFTSTYETYPVAIPNLATGYTQNLALSLFPRARWGMALTYEFNDRFATHNHRVGALFDWRTTSKLTLTAYLRVGSVKVVPKRTAYLNIGYQIGARTQVGARYTYDRLPWPGSLHRGSLNVQSGVTDHLQIFANVFGGALRHCGDHDFAEGASVGVRAARRRIKLGANYAFGTELERPPLQSYLTGQFSNDVCLDDLIEGASGSPVDLVATRAHTLGGWISYALLPRLILRAGYAAQFRLNGGRVELWHAALTTSY